MDSAASHEYTFKPLSVTEMRIAPNHDRVILVAQLVPNVAGQKPRICMLRMINDLTNPNDPNNGFWGGIPTIMALQLQAAIEREATIKVLFTSPMQERDENDDYYDVYTYAPTFLSHFNAIVIPNPADSTNFFSFRYRPAKRKNANDANMSKETLEAEISALPVTPDKRPGDVAPMYVAFTRDDLTFRSSDGGRIYGNWSPSFSGACLGGPNNSYIESYAVTSVERIAGPCSSGQQIIRWTYN